MYTEDIRISKPGQAVRDQEKGARTFAQRDHPIDQFLMIFRRNRRNLSFVNVDDLLYRIYNDAKVGIINVQDDDTGCTCIVDGRFAHAETDINDRDDLSRRLMIPFT